jgi:predicted nucleic acid-binding protein
MEVLTGARTDAQQDRLRRLLYSRCAFIPTEGPADYEEAAKLYRVCRRGGTTIRKLTGCLIAAVTIRAGAELLHHDGDFDSIARHTGLRIARL